MLETADSAPWATLAPVFTGSIHDQADATRSQTFPTQAGFDPCAFVQSVPALMMVTDREFRLLEASAAWLDAFSQSAESARGRALFEISPDHFDPLRTAFERCLAGEPFTVDPIRLVLKNGAVQFLKADLNPWRRADGMIGGLVGAALDVTDMVHALELTKRSEQRLKLAVEIADLHIWEIDYASGVIETDGAIESFFDGSFDDAAIVEDSNITIDPRDRALVADAWLAALEEDRPFRPEYRINRADGREVWATCTAKLSRGADGKRLRMIGAMQNITERKCAEAALIRAKQDAEAANQTKSAFLATMSHEIRTPLNGVLGMAQAMLNDDLSSLQRERLNVVRQSGETLLAILNDVLDLSKIEAGKLDVEMAEFAMSELAQGAYGAFTALSESKGLDFNLVIQPAARGRYRSDSTRIRQMLYNLVANALKFTAVGEVCVVVDRLDEMVSFKISDTGIGMSPQTMSRLFNKFEQADASTTRKFGGTGLGLAICQELAQLLGGSIFVSSAENIGSTFELVLPLERIGEESKLSQRSEETLSASIPVESVELRVLAAEDNAINRVVLKTLLLQVGIEPVFVDNGAEALAAFEAEAWDIILMDVQMPIMDGPTAVRKIRDLEMRTARSSTPIIALTANAMAHQVEEYFAAGMDAFVAKPISAANLFGTIDELLVPRDGANYASAA